MRIFQDLGIDERIEKVIDPQRALRWITYDGTEIMRVEHPPSTLGRKPRFYNIYQPTMEAELRRCGDAYGERLQVRYGAEVIAIEQDSDGVTLTSRDKATGKLSSVRARYAIAADGGSSPCRGMLGIDLLGDTNDVTWVVIDCRVKRWWPDRDFLTFWSDKNRPVVDIALGWQSPLGNSSHARRDTGRLPIQCRGLATAQGLGRDGRRCRDSPARVLQTPCTHGRHVAQGPRLPGR
jgi:3-(3-hydroxy-phenyl)propionate hydroxylase